MATVLLTGATGYIGSHTWLALQAAGFEVVGVDDFSNSSPEVLNRLQRLSGQPAGLRAAGRVRPAAMESLLQRHRIDAAVHFAAFKAVGESVAQPLAYYRNNVGGLVNVCAALQQHGVGVSSSAPAPPSTATRNGCRSPKIGAADAPPTPTARPS
jgi:UDP-glucose 4-epimerase